MTTPAPLPAETRALDWRGLAGEPDAAPRVARLFTVPV